MVPNFLYPLGLVFCSVEDEVEALMDAVADAQGGPLSTCCQCLRMVLRAFTPLGQMVRRSNGSIEVPVFWSNFIEGMPVSWNLKYSEDTSYCSTGLGGYAIVFMRLRYFC